MSSCKNNILFKTFFLSFFVFLFFAINTSKAEANSVYWYSASSTNWSDASNWWTSESHNIHANVPGNTDATILLGAVSPIANLDTWTAPASINSYGLTSGAKTSGVIFMSASSTGLTIAITGNATFDGTAQNQGVVIGNAIFNGGSNENLVFGNATFNNSTFNDGTVSDNATFNDSSYNKKVVNGNAFYTNPSYQQFNNQGQINGDATLAFASAGTATFTNTSWGTVLGTIKGSDGLTVNNFIFTGGNNYGTLNGTSTFIGTNDINVNRGSVNLGTTTNAIFTINALNYGVVTGTATFNGRSQNILSRFENRGGEVTGTAIFNASSSNNMGTVANAIFNDDAVDNGIVTGNATFNDNSQGFSFTSINGNALFNGDNSFSCGAITGTKTRRYTSNATTTINFTSGYSSAGLNGPWIIQADGANVHIGDPTFYNLVVGSSTYTTMQTPNEGSFDLTEDDDTPLDQKPFTCNGAFLTLIDPGYAPTLSASPLISNISATPTSNGATINWITSTSSNSVINASNQTFGLATINSGTTTNHSLAITNTASCSTYQYKVASVNSDKVASISSNQNFTTTGCTGNAPILEATSTPDVSTSVKTDITFNGNNGKNLFLSVPANFTNTINLATFELTRIDSNSLINAVSTPSGFDSINSNAYQLTALVDSNKTLNTFIAPLTLTMNYSPSDLGGIDPSLISIQRYDVDTGWTALPNCSVDTSTNTVTCTTDHFSVFSLFGLHPAPSRNRSGGHSVVKLTTVNTSLTSPAIAGILPTSDTELSAVEVAQLKAELNAKITSLMKQLIQLLSERLNHLLGF